MTVLSRFARAGHTTLLGVLALVLSACGGGPSIPLAHPASSAVPPSALPTPTTSSAPAVTRTSATTSSRSPAKPAGASAALVAVVGISDGDTIRVRINGITERVRIIGINAPEMSPRECFAQQAASKMQSLVQSKSVRLAADRTQADRDRHSRLLRHVFLTDGQSVAQIMIAGGFGREYTYAAPYAGRDAYRQAESSARRAGLGIWSSGCALPPPAPTTSVPTPAAPRTSTAPPNRTPAPQPAVGGSCTIKGNINSKGERIYHVPGQRHYEQTQINEAKGERWFCSEQAAVNAGWRKSKI